MDAKRDTLFNMSRTLSIGNEGPRAVNLNCLPFLGHEKWEVFGEGKISWTPS